jgi:hypothetical protein
MQFWLQESDTAETMHSKINFEVTVFLPESALFIILFCIKPSFILPQRLDSYIKKMFIRGIDLLSRCNHLH